MDDTERAERSDANGLATVSGALTNERTRLIADGGAVDLPALAHVATAEGGSPPSAIELGTEAQPASEPLAGVPSVPAADVPPSDGVASAMIVSPMFASESVQIC